LRSTHIADERPSALGKEMRRAGLEDARGTFLLMFLQRIQHPALEVGKELTFPGH
jgi:hypothetical protein